MKQFSRVKSEERRKGGGPFSEWRGGENVAKDKHFIGNCVDIKYESLEPCSSSSSSGGGSYGADADDDSALIREHSLAS